MITIRLTTSLGIIFLHLTFRFSPPSYLRDQAGICVGSDRVCRYKDVEESLVWIEARPSEETHLRLRVKFKFMEDQGGTDLPLQLQGGARLGGDLSFRIL